MPTRSLAQFRGRRKVHPRTTTLSTAVAPGERDSVYRALFQAGHANPSVGVRAVLFAYRDSEEVRQAVTRAAASLQAAA